MNSRRNKNKKRVQAMTDVQQPSLLETEGDTESTNGNDVTNGNASRSPRGAKRAKEPLTSKQQLNSTIKSVRDQLRKDAGLSGDTDLIHTPHNLTPTQFNGPALREA